MANVICTHLRAIKHKKMLTLATRNACGQNAHGCRVRMYFKPKPNRNPNCTQLATSCSYCQCGLLF